MLEQLLDFTRPLHRRSADQQARQRLSHTGRAPTKRVVSTPMLLKGLEFDHVLIPDASKRPAKSSF
jgi:DNA helicase IV